MAKGLLQRWMNLELTADVVIRGGRSRVLPTEFEKYMQ
jgi:hypothetical protein